MNDRQVRRPYRVVFKDIDHGATRRSTIIARNRGHARREAQSIARSGRRAEIHYVTDEGDSTPLEVHEP